VESEYVLYGSPISLFTRKLEAALRFYGAPFRFEAKGPDNGPEIEARAGTHQVPALRTPENWLIADTTPIIECLDARFPRRRLIPTGPLGVLVHIAEEVLDEWVARVMVHYRWHYEENTQAVVSRILGRRLSIEQAREFPLAKWGPRACRATGTESTRQRDAAEREYLGIMDALEVQLAATRYALGDRPTAVDTILLGGLRAHTNADPIPDLNPYEKVLRWDASEADGWQGDGELAAFPDSTPLARHLLDLARDRYAPVVLGNARALARGDKAFEVEVYGEPVSFLTRAYPEQSRQMIRRRIRDRLDDGERSAVRAWLEKAGLAECFG